MERIDPQDMEAIGNMVKAHTGPISKDIAVVAQQMSEQESRWADHKEEHTDLKTFLHDVNTKTNHASDGVKKLWYGLGGAGLLLSAAWALVTFFAR